MNENTFELNGIVYDFKSNFKEKKEVEKGLQNYYANLLQQAIKDKRLKANQVEELTNFAELISDKARTQEEYTKEELKNLEKHADKIELLNPIPYFEKVIRNYLEKNYDIKTDDQWDEWQEDVCVEFLDGNISALEQFIVQLYSNVFTLAVKQSQKKQQ